MSVSANYFGWYNKELRRRGNVLRFKLVVCMYICAKESVVRLSLPHVCRESAENVTMI